MFVAGPMLRTQQSRNDSSTSSGSAVSCHFDMIHSKDEGNVRYVVRTQANSEIHSPRLRACLEQHKEAPSALLSTFIAYAMDDTRVRGCAAVQNALPMCREFTATNINNTKARE